MQTSPTSTSSQPIGPRPVVSAAHFAKQQANSPAENSTVAISRPAISLDAAVDQLRIRASNELSLAEMREVTSAASEVLEGVGVLSPLSSGQFAQAAAQSAIDKLDTDGDGRLTIEELPLGEKMFMTIDTDGTGTIGIEELTTRMHQDILEGGMSSTMQPDAYAAAWLQEYGILKSESQTNSGVGAKLLTSAPPRPTAVDSMSALVSDPLIRPDNIKVESKGSLETPRASAEASATNAVADSPRFSNALPLTNNGTATSEAGILPPSIFELPDVDTHHSHLRDVAQAIAEKFEANGFVNELPTNVTQLFDSMKLNTNDRSFLLDLLSQHFPNGFGIDKSA